MKKTLLFTALLIGGLSQLKAQCIVAPSCSVGTTGYCTTPAANSSLPNGTELSSYNTTIQLSIGSSAGGFATIISSTLTSVSGLPSGLTYSTNPISGVMPANSNACLLLSGTPASGSAGTYTIIANVSVETNIGTLPGTASWNLIIDPAATGIKSYNVASDFFISPNPATSELFLSSGSHFGKIQIVDALGKIVILHDANYTSQTTINISALNKGVYFLQANDGNRVITKKFIKD